MTIRIREGQITAVLIEEWHKIQLNTFRVDQLEIMTADANHQPLVEWGFSFVLAGNDSAVMAGPLTSIKGYRMVKE